MQASEMTLEQHVKHVVTSGPLRDLLLRIVKECKPPVVPAVTVTRNKPFIKTLADNVHNALASKDSE